MAQKTLSIPFLLLDISGRLYNVDVDLYFDEPSLECSLTFPAQDKPFIIMAYAQFSYSYKDDTMVYTTKDYFFQELFEKHSNLTEANVTSTFMLSPHIKTLDERLYRTAGTSYDWFYKSE